MVESGGLPRSRRVAVIALGGREDVIRVFSGRGCTVVARGAATLHLRVINAKRGLPRGCCVASLARRARSDVRRTLASGLGSVVAACAIRCDSGVIKARRLPGIGVVARATVR